MAVVHGPEKNISSQSSVSQVQPGKSQRIKIILIKNTFDLLIQKLKYKYRVSTLAFLSLSTYLHIAFLSLSYCFIAFNHAFTKLIYQHNLCPHQMICKLVTILCTVGTPLAPGLIGISNTYFQNGLFTLYHGTFIKWQLRIVAPRWNMTEKIISTTTFDIKKDNLFRDKSEQRVLKYLGIYSFKIGQRSISTTFTCRSSPAPTPACCSPADTRLVITVIPRHGRIQMSGQRLGPRWGGGHCKYG